MFDRTTLTRRSAIRTGTLSALGVGLMTAAGAPPVAAGSLQPAAELTLIAALCAEPTPGADARFEEWLAIWRSEHAAVSAEHRAILDQIKAYVPADRQYELVGKLSDLS